MSHPARPRQIRDASADHPDLVAEVALAYGAVGRSDAAAPAFRRGGRHRGARVRHVARNVYPYPGPER